VHVFAYDYPLLGVFWSMLMIFIWIAWIFLLIRIFADIFRNHEMSGWAKALWSIFIIVVPFLGTLIYLIVHGGDMSRRDVAAAQASEQRFQEYVRQTVSSTGGSGGSSAEELAKLADLRDRGVLTPQEFEAQKAKILSTAR